MRIQGSRPFAWSHIAIDTEAGNLAQGMHASIRPSGTDDRHSDLGDTENGSFNGRLNGRLVGLTLPAGIGGAVIFEGELYGGHVRTSR